MNRIGEIRFYVVVVGAVLGLALLAVPRQAEASPVDIFCNVRNVVVWTTPVGFERVHVLCVETFTSGGAAGGPVKFFAFPASEADAVARILTILTTARVSGTTLVINTDFADTSGASFGCQASDCRRIRAVGF